MAGVAMEIEIPLKVKFFNGFSIDWVFSNSNSKKEVLKIFDDQNHNL